MKERFKAVEPDADQRQAERFKLWEAAEGIPFESEAAQAAYQDRVTCLKNAIQLEQKPARIPICPSAGFFPLEYAGISMHQAMYDFEALKTAWEKYYFDFMPDALSGIANIVPGRPLDVLEFTLYEWPGHGVAKDGEYQFVEREYMQQAEYEDLIDDPTAFMLNKYFPRIFGALKPFEAFPRLPLVHEIPAVPPFLCAFGGEPMKKALAALMQAGDECLRWRSMIAKINTSIMARGIPAFSGGFTKAPFDMIGDSLRGTKGIMLDMFRCPDAVLEACERLTPLMVKSGIGSCMASGHPIPFIPLHKGADNFMSPDMFDKFYWPTLRKLIIGLINAGLVPLLFAEGAYNKRLEIISDLPKGKTIWWFDRTDLVRAKETVGQVACIAGNFPLSLLCTADPDDVKTACRKMIEAVGTEGGYIFSSGAGMQGAKPENVRMMFETVREYAGI